MRRLPKKLEIVSHLEDLIIECSVLGEDHEVEKFSEMAKKIRHEIKVFENAGYNLQLIKEHYSDLVHIYSNFQ